MSEDKPLTENLSEYRKAMEEELKTSSDSTSDVRANNARERLFELLPDASEELMHILRVGTKDDAIRFQAIKFIFEYTLGKPVALSNKEDDVEKVIQSLMAKHD